LCAHTISSRDIRDPDNQQKGDARDTAAAVKVRPQQPRKRSR
jgi:hypothetical protein